MAVITSYKVISTLGFQILNHVTYISHFISILLSQTFICQFLLVSMSTLPLDEVAKLIKMLSDTNQPARQQSGSEKKCGHNQVRQVQEERRKMELRVLREKKFPSICFHATRKMEWVWFYLQRPVQLIKQEYYGLFLWSYCWLVFVKECNGWKRANGNERKTACTLWNLLDVQICWDTEDQLPMNNL